jgi:hypothetical protein
MADILGKAIKITAKGFDLERKKLFRGLTALALLTRDGRENVFSELRNYISGFIPRSNTFRTGFYVEIATLDDLKLDILKLTHFALDGQCYAVGDGDIFPPSGDRFTWMIYGTFVKDTYTPEV